MPDASTVVDDLEKFEKVGGFGTTSDRNDVGQVSSVSLWCEEEARLMFEVVLKLNESWRRGRTGVTLCRSDASSRHFVSS